MEIDGTEDKVDVSIGLKEEIDKGARVWKWVDNTPLNYQNWHDGYPQPAPGDAMRCATYFTDTLDYDPMFGKWKHVSCDNVQQRAICAKQSDYQISSKIQAVSRLKLRTDRYSSQKR